MRDHDLDAAPAHRGRSGSELRHDRPLLRLVDGALLLVALIWGSNFVVMKLAFSVLTPLAFNSVRFTFAALTQLAILLAYEGWIRMPLRDWLKLIGLGLVGHTLFQSLIILGLDLTRPEHASLIMATVPVWAALLAGLIGWERVTGRMWNGIVLSFIGVALVVSGHDGFTFAELRFWGDLMVLGAALSWGSYTAFSKDVLRRYSPLRVSAVTLIAGLPGIWIITAPDALATLWTDVPLWAWGAIVFSGSFAIALNYFIWSTGIQRVGAARTAVYNNLVPVVTFLITFFALEQPIFALQITGGIVALVGVYLTVRSR